MRRYVTIDGNLQAKQSVPGATPLQDVAVLRDAGVSDSMVDHLGGNVSVPVSDDAEASWLSSVIEGALTMRFFCSLYHHSLPPYWKPPSLGTSASTLSGSPAPYSGSSHGAPRVDSSPFHCPEMRVLPGTVRLPLKEDIIFGKTRASSGLSVGRQAQMIPVLHSMADQAAAPTLSSDGFS